MPPIAVVLGVVLGALAFGGGMAGGMGWLVGIGLLLLAASLVGGATTLQAAPAPAPRPRGRRRR